ncbi:hypothetical protein JST97_34030 [bacterium]|nr:hypothetical protein [bacterium]
MAFGISGFGNNSYNQGIQGLQPPPPPPPPQQSYADTGLDCTSFSGDALGSLNGDNLNGQMQAILQNLMQGGSSAF